MVQDIEKSKALEDEFKKSKISNKLGKFELYIRVLTNGCWPDLTEDSKT